MSSIIAGRALAARVPTAMSAALAATALAGAAKAGGFQLNERSPKALGTSLAGSVSAASDVSFAAFNPAALSVVDTLATAGSASLVAPIAEGTIVDGPARGLPADADSARGLVAGAGGLRLTEGLVLGFAMNSLFGLVTTYPNDFPSAGDAVTSELLTINFSPMVAYEVLPGLTFGAAANILYVDARLTNAAINLDGATTEFGFSVGALWEPIDGTRLGVAWHNGYDVEVSGRHENAIIGQTASTAVFASLPGTLQVGVTQEIGDDIRLMGEVRWINWSVFDSYLFALETATVGIETGPVAGSTIEYDGGAHVLSIGAAISF